MLAAWVVLGLSGSAWPASRTIDIVINSLDKTDGQLRGSETYTLEEHVALSALKAGGEPALSGCLLDSLQTATALGRHGLTVRKIETAITRQQYTLSWEADFTELPSSYGPLSGMSLTETDKKAREYTFSAQLGGPSTSSGRAASASAGQAEQGDEGLASVLKDYAFSVSVRFPGTVQNHILGPGHVDHTGESVVWKTQLASLKDEAVELGASATPGRATEQQYWMVLMTSLTVVMVILMIGVLRRGARKAKRS